MIEMGRPGDLSDSPNSRKMIRYGDLWEAEVCHLRALLSGKGGPQKLAIYHRDASHTPAYFIVEAEQLERPL